MASPKNYARNSESRNLDGDLAVCQVTIEVIFEAQWKVFSRFSTYHFGYCMCIWYPIEWRHDRQIMIINVCGKSRLRVRWTLSSWGREAFVLGAAAKHHGSFREVKLCWRKGTDMHRWLMMIGTWRIICAESYIWLVVWNMHFMTFPSYWECHHPNWLSYFSEGLVGIPPTSFFLHFSKPPTSIIDIPSGYLM